MAGTACDPADLKINLVVNCDAPLAKGLGEQIFTGRIRDLDSITYDATNKKIIRNIVLKPGKKLKRWIGQNFSNNATLGFSAGEYGNTVTQSLRYVLFSKDPLARSEVDNILQINDIFAIVLVNGNPAQFDVYGWRTGMRLTNLSSDTNDDALKGAIVLDLTAEEKTTQYTFQHMSTDAQPKDDTAATLETLALAL